LRNLFEEAIANAPSIIFIDEIDGVAPKRDEGTDLDTRIVSTLMNLMDSLSTIEKVLVIGATNRVEAVDASLRRPGRFDTEVEIGVPNQDSREEILKIHLSKISHSLTSKELNFVAQKTHGFVGADIEGLCKEASMNCLRRVWSNFFELLTIVETKSEAPPEDQLFTTLDDLLLALKNIKPSAMREVVVEVPHVSWAEIGGYSEVKQKLKESVEWPLQHPESFERMGIAPPKGILLYGPPGCSKTLMAKALATESKLNFIAVKGPEVLMFF
jgi:AAA family ATPase